MKVSGLASKTCSPAISARAVSARHWRFLTSTPQSFAMRSIVRKPRLCGVNWYSIPGLPNPTISFTPDQFASTTKPRRASLDQDGRGRPSLRCPRLLLFFLLCLFRLLGCFRALFALDFLLALLDDFGLGRGGSCVRSDRIRGRSHFFLN